MDELAPKKTVYVIDDTSFIRTYIQSILKNSNFNVELFESPMLAIKKIKKNKCDLVLLDINMPEMSGFHFLEQLSKEKIYKPVCIISSQSNHSDVLTGIRLGAMDYMVKPIQPQILLKKVHQLLGEFYQSDQIAQVDFKFKLTDALIECNIQVKEISINGFIAESKVKFIEGCQACFHSEKFNQSANLKKSFDFQSRVIQVTQNEEGLYQALFQFVGLDQIAQKKLAAFLQHKNRLHKKYLKPA